MQFGITRNLVYMNYGVRDHDGRLYDAVTYEAENGM